MTTEHSTYTYESGTQETVTLSRGRLTPTGQALLKIAHSDGRKSDCYVDLAWLRDRADQLSDKPRTLAPDAITDDMVERGARQYIEEDYTSWERSPALAKNNARESVRGILEAALTEPLARPEGAEEIEALIEESLSGDALSDAQVRTLADFLVERGIRVVAGEDPR